MENVGETRAGIAGWIAWGAVILLGFAGAASSPAGLLIGVPLAPEVAIAVSATAALAAAAGLRQGALALGLVPLLVLIAVGIPLPGLGALTGGPLLALALAVAAVALARARPAWARRAFIPALLVLHLFAAARAQQQVGPEGDEPHYLMVAASLLEDGDLALQDDYAAGRYRAFHPADLEPHYRVRGRDGAIYSLHAVGLSLLILPAYAAGGYAGGLLLHGDPRRRHRVAGAGARARDARGPRGGRRRGMDRRRDARRCCTSRGSCSRRSPRRWVSPSRSGWPWPRHRSRGPGARGWLLASLPWLNVRYAILAAIVLAAALARRPPLRVAAGWLLPMAASAAALAAFHHVLYGFYDPRRVYGQRPEFSAATIPTGLPGLLFDQEFGLWVYAPVFALAVPGLVRLARTRRLEAAAAIGLVAAVLAVASAWPMWRGGFNPPARFLLPVLPAMALGVACWLKRGLSFPAAMLIGWSAWTGLAGAVDRPLVHRDRDGTAPFFRAHSGALEWTRLLPGYVLDESARDRLPLTAIWAVALGAAARGAPASDGDRASSSDGAGCSPPPPSRPASGPRAPAGAMPCGCSTGRPSSFPPGPWSAGRPGGRRPSSDGARCTSRIAIPTAPRSGRASRWRRDLHPRNRRRPSALDPAAAGPRSPERAWMSAGRGSPRRSGRDASRAGFQRARRRAPPPWS